MEISFSRADVQLLLPVGSYESLSSAIQAGADAIYFGIGSLNMRSKSAANFTPEDLDKIVKVAHENSIRTYLTVNTIVYDNDYPQLLETVQQAKASGVDAVIASDIAAIMAARAVGIPVHASTQLNISNSQAVKFFSQYCDTVVLARELNLEQVANIQAFIEGNNICGPSGRLLQIESFCHGALCMAVSGQCYLSLHEYNRSANRGSCTQVCRRSYTAQDTDTKRELQLEAPYILSPKDLCTLPFLDKLLMSGTRVLKVEGRARGPEYVLTVGKVYNKALELFFNQEFSPETVEPLMADLKKVFNRGFWDGYYMGQTIAELSSAHGSKATHIKEFIATCRNYYSKLGVAEFQMLSGDLKLGDEYLVIGQTTGTIPGTVSELRTERDPLPQVNKGDVFAMPVPNPVRRGDKLYKWINSGGERS